MRRLALLIGGGALWLLFSASPALADGGPHVMGTNSGSSGIGADSCAGCHRAHTAQGAMLLVADEHALCETCHGAGATGAATDVDDGIQYNITGTDSRGAVLGALRGGGFVNARIDTSHAVRLAYTSGTSVRQLGGVPVRASGQAVTSTHLGSGTAWGNGDISASANPGATMSLSCTSCHNPHGNGQYRILNPIPSDGSGGLTEALTPAPVDDAALPSSGDVRNYTVIQKKGTEGDNSTYLLYASNLLNTDGTLKYAETVGEYFHRRVPWNSSSGANDAPNGKPSTFDSQINAWCAQCHTRYLAATSGIAYYATDSTDAIFRYRHSNTSNKPCTTCHVSHGSNAQMTDQDPDQAGIQGYSANQAWPGGAAAPVGDSRLLKIDNRGTCQACHDPTQTITSGTQVGGPAPVLP